MTMPRSVEEIIAHADEYATRFENWSPTPEELAAKTRDVRFLHQLRAAVADRGQAEANLLDAVRAARDAGYSWAAVGGELGTTAAAAQQKYGKLMTPKKR
ncbi:MAG: hypothetical protein GX610_05835 [Rhodococcus sp.]|nr:hypothetical protein [Rhodococcus sp. (in: high G+C Gram-positive bacteria)]